jgi:hypothetical protein
LFGQDLQVGDLYVRGFLRGAHTAEVMDE